MGKVLCFANHKGGVGKTTSVANIGKALALKKKKVLLIDTDAQCNLTTFFMDENTVEKSVFDSLINKMPLDECKVEIDKYLHLVPASIELASAERLLNLVPIRRESIMADRVAAIRDKYDFILIDCPPALGLVTSNNLVACDSVYIPLMGETLSVKGISMLEDFIELVQPANPSIHIGGVFITRFNNRKLNNVILSVVQERFGEVLLNTKIRECISIAEAPAENKTIFDYAPDSNGAEDYTNIAKEIINKEK